MTEDQAFACKLPTKTIPRLPILCDTMTHNHLDQWLADAEISRTLGLLSAEELRRRALAR